MQYRKRPQRDSNPHENDVIPQVSADFTRISRADTKGSTSENSAKGGRKCATAGRLTIIADENTPPRLPALARASECAEEANSHDDEVRRLFEDGVELAVTQAGSASGFRGAAKLLGKLMQVMGDAHDVDPEVPHAG